VKGGRERPPEKPEENRLPDLMTNPGRRGAPGFFHAPAGRSAVKKWAKMIL